MLIFLQCVSSFLFRINCIRLSHHANESDNLQCSSTRDPVSNCSNQQANTTCNKDKKKVNAFSGT